MLVIIDLAIAWPEAAPWLEYIAIRAPEGTRRVWAHEAQWLLPTAVARDGALLAPVPRMRHPLEESRDREYTNQLRASKDSHAAVDMPVEHGRSMRHWTIWRGGHDACADEVSQCSVTTIQRAATAAQLLARDQADDAHSVDDREHPQVVTAHAVPTLVGWGARGRGRDGGFHDVFDAHERLPSCTGELDTSTNVTGPEEPA